MLPIGLFLRNTCSEILARKLPKLVDVQNARKAPLEVVHCDEFVLIEMNDVQTSRLVGAVLVVFAI